VRESYSAAFYFSKKLKKFFQIGKKPSYLDFRITPRNAKGGEIGYDGKRAKKCHIGSSLYA